MIYFLVILILSYKNILTDTDFFIIYILKLIIIYLFIGKWKRINFKYLIDLTIPLYHFHYICLHKYPNKVRGCERFHKQCTHTISKAGSTQLFVNNSRQWIFQSGYSERIPFVVFDEIFFVRSTIRLFNYLP